MSWENYLTQVPNKFDPEKGEYILSGIVQHAAIFSLEGEKWAATPGFTLTEYDFEFQIDDVNKEMCHVNEVDIFKMICSGRRDLGTAGARLNNEKFMIVQPKNDFGMVKMAKRAGGATIAVAKTCAVIGIWTNMQ